MARLSREHSAVELEARKAPSPQLHRVPRMPKHYKREALGELGRDALARALVLPWAPEACLKCANRVLRERGLEVSCPVCGWAQVVRR